MIKYEKDDIEKSYSIQMHNYLPRGVRMKGKFKCFNFCENLFSLFEKIAGIFAVIFFKTQKFFAKISQ
jgi:hypothetical protein